MKIVHIPKRNGTFRTIYVPSPDERVTLIGQIRLLASIAKQLDVHGVQHGFVQGRSPVTNAMQHVGWAYTVSFDIKDFFDSVTPEKVALLTNLAIPEEFVDGAARQGLPTSPSLANIAAVPIDNDIMALRKRGRFLKYNFVYTRYADDLTFSCDQFGMVQRLLETVPGIIERHGFSINASKTKVQYAGAGRRMITGVAVDSDGVHVPREIKRRLRAAANQSDGRLCRRLVRGLLAHRRNWKRRKPLRFRFYLQARGLLEWSKLRLPKAQSQSMPPSSVAGVVHATVRTIAGQAMANRLFGCYGRKFA